MTVEFLSDLQTKANDLSSEAKRLMKSLDLALSRVSNVLDKDPTEPLSVNAKCFQVCTRGPHCGRRGGTEVFQSLETLLADDDSANVEESDCLRHCGQGPNLLLDGILYSAMDEKKAAELVERIRSSSKLPIDLLLNDNNRDDFLRYEEARSLLTICLTDMSGTAVALKANIEAAAGALPEYREERMVRMNLILKVIKTEKELLGAIEVVQNKLGSIVPLDAFVETIFATEISAWKKQD